MKVNDRVTVKTDGGPRRPGVVLAIEEVNEGTMYLVSLEDYPLGIWFFNELGHPDGILWKRQNNAASGNAPDFAASTQKSLARPEIEGRVQ